MLEGTSPLLCEVLSY